MKQSSYSKVLVVLNHSVVSNPLRPHGLQPARLLCPRGFSRQEYWSGLPCPPPGNLPNPGIKPRSSALQADSLPSELGAFQIYYILILSWIFILLTFRSLILKLQLKILTYLLKIIIIQNGTICNFVLYFPGLL